MNVCVCVGTANGVSHSFIHSFPFNNHGNRN